MLGMPSGESHLGASAGTASLNVGWALFLVGLGVIHYITYIARERIDFESWPGWLFSLALGAAVALALPWVATRHVPFIYFQF